MMRPVFTAWDLIGYDVTVRTVGARIGRIDWDGVEYNDDTRQTKPKLYRLVPVDTPDGPRLRVITRYLDPDAELVVTAHEENLPEGVLPQRHLWVAS